MKLHKLKEGYILTSNEEIKKGDLRLDFYQNGLPNNIREVTDVVIVDGPNDKIIDYGPFNLRYSVEKVIAQQDQLMFSNLTEEEQKKIGWFDLNMLAANSIKNRDFISGHSMEARIRSNEWKNGFQKAQELLSDKAFTENDLVKLGLDFIIKQPKDITEMNLVVMDFIKEKHNYSWNVEAIKENDRFRITKIL